MQWTYFFRTTLMSLLLLSQAVESAAESQTRELQDAINLYVEGRYQDALGRLEPLADAGRSEAQLLLGVFYERGYVVERDEVIAYSWYLRSARLHNQKANQALGRLSSLLQPDQIDKAEQFAEDQRIILNKDFGCISFFGEPFSAHYVTSFQAQNAIDSMVKDILAHTGLTKNFLIQAANVPNAAAVIQGSTRYVLYNPQFINEVNDKSLTAWAAYSVMAHEIGHHLEGHTIQPGGSRPTIELDADRFSGFILAKMGATLSDAKAAMATLASPYRSATHPARDERLAAIEEGWRKATSKETPSTEHPPPSVVQVSPLSPVPSPSAPSSAIARVCATPHGACPMMVPIRVGSVCYCATPYGSVPGYSR